jgi:Domain of unknown function (DUF5753)
VLRRPISNRHAMVEQLRHLATSNDRHNVAVRIVPLSAGLHSGAVAGSFTILDFPGDGRDPEPSTVYTESLSGALYLEKPKEVETYQAIWNSLVGLALDEAQSLPLISQIAEEYARQ